MSLEFNIHKFKKHVADDLTINDGEFITILGTSGGGKTTMLNIIGTIDKPSKGDVYICGLRIKYSTKD